MDQQQKPAKLKLTALWAKTLSNGTTIFTGKLGDAQIEIWPNQFKQKDNQPDYNIFLVPPFKKDQPAQQQATQQNFGQPDFSSDFGNDIPF